MVAALQELVRYALVVGAGIFVVALFAVGIFFVVSLLLVPLAALRPGSSRQEVSIERDMPEGE